MRPIKHAERGLTLIAGGLFNAIQSVNKYKPNPSFTPKWSDKPLLKSWQKSKPTLGLEGLLGQIGEVKARLNPAGKVFVHGEYWNAEADAEVDVGEKVEVIGYQGMSLKVRPLTHRAS